jgi:hypothetical protein
MIGFNGGLIGGLADARETSLLSAVGVWTLNEQRNAKLAGLWPLVLTGVAATGGTVTDITDGGVSYRVHTFTSNGSFVVTTGGAVEYLVVAVAGGGGGGLQAAPGLYGGMVVGLQNASEGDSRVFLNSWNAAFAMGLLSAELIVTVQEIAAEYDLPEAFIDALG